MSDPHSSGWIQCRPPAGTLIRKDKPFWSQSRPATLPPTQVKTQGRCSHWRSQQHKPILPSQRHHIATNTTHHHNHNTHSNSCVHTHCMQSYSYINQSSLKNSLKFIQQLNAKLTAKLTTSSHTSQVFTQTIAHTHIHIEKHTHTFGTHTDHLWPLLLTAQC